MCVCVYGFFEYLFQFYEAKKLNLIVDETMGIDSEMFVHVDACKFDQCSICEVGKCEYRKEEFKEKVNWDLEILLQDEHHGI